MFDIGFSELMMIGVVALVVLGPERLPKVARTAGEWMGKLQRYVADVKVDINRQMDIAELRKMQEEVKEAAKSIEASVHGAVDQHPQGTGRSTNQFSDRASGQHKA